MRMAEAGNMGDMGIMMLYGTVMLGLCIAGIGAYHQAQELGVLSCARGVACGA